MTQAQPSAAQASDEHGPTAPALSGNDGARDQGLGPSWEQARAPHDHVPDRALQRAYYALVRYGRFDALQAQIARCQRLSKLGDEPECMALEGATGAGKSTLATRYARDYPRRDTAEGTVVPVFSVQTPSPATVKSMASAMLKGLGDPAWNRGTTSALNARLIELMAVCGVELVILDDFHHLIDTDTDRILRQVSEWLKTLLKETRVPFFVIGMPGKVKRILDADPAGQLSRLFKVRETLAAFPWDPAIPSAQQDFGRFVAHVEQAIGLSLTDEWSRDELCARLHYATEGVVGHLMALLRKAVLAADEAGATRLELAAMATGFDEGVRYFFPRKRNPFLKRGGIGRGGKIPLASESGLTRRNP